MMRETSTVRIWRDQALSEIPKPEDEVITKAGSTYTGGGQTTTTAGSVVLKPGWATR
jgi:uncharacterized RmlC-like cupin family protein